MRIGVPESTEVNISLHRAGRAPSARAFEAKAAALALAEALKSTDSCTPSAMLP